MEEADELCPELDGEVWDVTTGCWRRARNEVGVGEIEGLVLVEGRRLVLVEARPRLVVVEAKLAALPFVVTTP